MIRTIPAVVLAAAISFLSYSCGTSGKSSGSSSADAVLNAKEAEKVISVLASDEMKGRKVFTPEIDKAADFIADEFKAAGLETWGNSGSYLQRFAVYTPKQVTLTAQADGAAVDAQKIFVITTQPSLEVNEKSGYEIVKVPAGGNLLQKVNELNQKNKNILVVADPSYANNFSRLSFFKRNMFQTSHSVIVLMATEAPTTFSVSATHTLTEQKLANVVGVLPGKSKKNEYVIFSGHYDHIGIGRPVNGDSIYNGANDDAAGTTAVILLARYFKKLNNNERTIVFAAFTAEESGGFGSRYFSKQFDPVNVMAMFNIEMIGTDSKWGKNSAYITGYERTNMGEILQKNLAGTGFTFHPDPYPDQQLFFRSDNATLAALGVPAHTISTSKMDNEPNYHKPSDHVSTLDMENMAMIIKSIALSSRSIVAGTDTPSRVNVNELER